MEIVEFIRDWGAHVMSACGIIAGIFMYLRHDRVIKKQEQYLNDLQIKQIKKAEESQLKAQVGCNVIPHEKGEREVRFFNSGPADARNVRIEILNREELREWALVDESWGPYELLTAHYGMVKEVVQLCYGHPDTLNVRITWDDDFAENRSILQSPQL
jgi:hypothetical protein